MEPCMYRNETLNCYSPPPKFDVPEPRWCFPPTTTEEPPTTHWTTAVTSIATTLVSTVTETLAPNSTVDVGSTGPTFTTPVSTTTEIPEPKSTTVPIEPTFTTPEPTTITEEPPKWPPWLILIVVLVIVIAFIVIVIVLWCWRKRRNERGQLTTEVHPSFLTQKSTIGLIVTDEPGGNSKTDLAGKDTVCDEYDGKLTTENDYIASSKDGSGVDDKPAPVVKITEL